MSQLRIHVAIGVYILAVLGCSPTDPDTTPAVIKAKQKLSKTDKLKWVDTPTAKLRGKVFIEERVAVLTPKLIGRLKELMKSGKIYAGRVWRGPGPPPMLPPPRATIFITDSEGENYPIDLLPRNLVWPRGGGDSEMREIGKELFDDVLGELYTLIIEAGKSVNDDVPEFPDEE